MNEKFNSNTSDIKFRSADGIEFNLHRTLLETYTGAFPGPELDTRGEVIQLTEPGNVLQILFDFVYPKRHPDLEDTDFELVAAVAEAVGKYEVYSAINTCNTRLRSFLPKHATEIFVYAMKHDHPKLADETAPCIVWSPLIPILKKLPQCYLLPWTQYHEAWFSILRDARREIKSMPSVTQLSLCHSGVGGALSVCNTCRSSLFTWIANLEELDTVLALKSALSTARLINTVPCCKAAVIADPARPRFDFNAIHIMGQKDTKCDHMVNLAKTCEDKIKAIPPFSKFLGGEE